MFIYLALMRYAPIAMFKQIPCKEWKLWNEKAVYPGNGFLSVKQYNILKLTNIFVLRKQNFSYLNYFNFNLF